VSGIVDERSDLAASVDATGRFRIYLGAAPGVGKTYAMLSEGIRRKRRGIAFLQ
jgi:two-component system sensor histidine kinase KdpD